MLTLLQANTADLLIQEAAAPEKMSLIKMAVAGGWLMIVLLILSIIAIYILGNRLWAIRQAGKLDPHFMANIRELVRAGKTSSAISLCRENSSPIARLIEKGLERQGNPLPDIQAAVENVANIEVAKLEKGLPMLATVAGGAPMIGFLGTVIGMIQAFYNMASAGSNIDITLLSGGIYTAMVTTVGGGERDHIADGHAQFRQGGPSVGALRRNRFPQTGQAQHCRYCQDSSPQARRTQQPHFRHRCQGYCFFYCRSCRL